VKAKHILSWAKQEIAPVKTVNFDTGGIIISPESKLRFPVLVLQETPAGWQSGYAAACKAVDAGSIPTPASKNPLARVVKLVDTRDLKSLAG
jgi:hypothetical protein